MALYRAEVHRVHAGENYYLVAAQELVARGYPTRSVFNWRTPLPMWLIAVMPAPVFGKVVLCLLGLALMLLAFEAVSREQPNIYRGPLPLAVLLAGPLLPCLLGDLYVLPVLWAGIFIGLSVCAYGVDRPYLGAAAGLAAVFFRELALPYCLLGRGPGRLAQTPRRTGRLAHRPGGLGGLLRPALAASQTTHRPRRPRPSRGMDPVRRPRLRPGHPANELLPAGVAAMGHHALSSWPPCAAWPAGIRRWASGSD